jgi:hypothetical protein
MNFHFYFKRLLSQWCLVVGLLFGIASNDNFAGTVQDPIVIAIIDDGMVPDLEIFEGMLWQNPGEVPNNAKDDDGNGRVDDVFGWDVSDQDEDVRPPVARLAEYPHGTYMAAQMAGLIRQSLGEMDDYPIKIMFIKGISDTAAYLHMQDGYQGLQTALEYSPDVINLSWSGGVVDDDASNALASARASDIFIVGAVGIFPQKEAAYPASHPAVFGVAGIDSDYKLFKSNYGDEVELAALSQGYPYALLGADSPEDIDGVSNSTALVTATVALMKLAKPTASNLEIKHCLQATAIPLEGFNIDFAGLLGAGALDIEAAIDCIKTGSSPQSEMIRNPKGSIIYKTTGKPKQNSREWVIAPTGLYDGLVLRPFVEGQSKKSTLSIYAYDSEAEGSNLGELIWGGLLSDLPAQIKTEYTALKFELEVNSNKGFEFQTRFETQNIDQSRRFCEGQKTITVDEMAAAIILSDGSGDNDYAINSDCKWTLAAKPGHDLVLEFLELGTEINVDSIYLFRGEEPLQTEFLMRISGSELPPKVIIEDGPALLWFTSDAQNQYQGFEVRITSIPHESDSVQVP